MESWSMTAVQAVKNVLQQDCLQDDNSTLERRKPKKIFFDMREIPSQWITYQFRSKIDYGVMLPQKPFFLAI